MTVVKYCPYLSCPHRQRVNSPAEFMDQVSVCSDCRTPLVSSESDALEGIRPIAGDPYRGLGARSFAEPSRSKPRAKNDTAVGLAFLVGGLLLTAVTYASASSSSGGGRYIVAWGPMLYGAFRLIRGASSGSSG
jgi:hypothetical protein